MKKHMSIDYQPLRAFLTKVYPGCEILKPTECSTCETEIWCEVLDPRPEKIDFIFLWCLCRIVPFPVWLEEQKPEGGAT